MSLLKATCVLPLALMVKNFVLKFCQEFNTAVRNSKREGIDSRGLFQLPFEYRLGGQQIPSIGLLIK